jgi:hypothetical protein
MLKAKERRRKTISYARVQEEANPMTLAEMMRLLLFYVEEELAEDFTEVPTHSLTGLLTHSLTGLFTHSLTGLLTYSLAYLLTHSLTGFSITNPSFEG